MLYTGVCLAFLPLLLGRDFTPANELRYLSIADEALREHTFFAFTNHGVAYADKPPLYLWLLMLCRWLTGGHHMALLGMFSLVPALLVVKTMDTWAKWEMEGESRALARLMLISGGLFAGAALILRMDMLMCLFITLSLRSFWRMREGGPACSRESWFFPIYLFLGVFTKGPFGLLIPLCASIAYLALTRQLRSVFRYWGWRTWGVLLGGMAVWFTAVYLEGGEAYLNNLLFHQTIDRAVNSFHHEAPFYYYTVCFWYALAPWSLLVVWVLWVAWRKKYVCGELQRFFLITGVVTLVVLSCVSGKLEIYMLPSIPFLIYSSAMPLSRFALSRGARVALGIPAVGYAIAFPLWLFLSTRVAAIAGGWIGLASALLSLAGLHALRTLRTRATFSLPIAVRSLGAGLLLAVFAAGCDSSRLNGYVGYARVCEKAMRLEKEMGVKDIRAWHVPRAENMDVYLHRPVHILPQEEVPSASQSSYLLIIPTKESGRFKGAQVIESGKFAVVKMEANKHQQLTIKDNDEQDT